MLPEYATKGHGEGFMHDTAMMLGALGWSDYAGQRRSHHPVLRRLRHRPDQRRLPRHAADRQRPFPPPQASVRQAGYQAVSRL